MKTTYDLSGLEWSLTGWIPYLWKLFRTVETGHTADAHASVPAVVPGSVQEALRRAGRIPDWTRGLNAEVCEWVENRHWIYEVKIPDDWFSKPARYHLECLGLDYCGEVYVNATQVGGFCGTHVPHKFDLTPGLEPGGNVLRIVFFPPPRWLGQFGYTSQMREWKPRFNYTWDWQPRLVQLGIWDDIRIVVEEEDSITRFRSVGDLNVETGKGILRIAAETKLMSDNMLQISLRRGDEVVRAETYRPAELSRKDIVWEDLDVELWWPNLQGGQPLYQVEVVLSAADGRELDREIRQVGFRNIQWKPCDGAPAQADPWVCVVNGVPVFLQGVNFPPLLPNFADADDGHYRQRLELYRTLGANTLRINACGYLEKEIFYKLCDELGLLVWQEFPLTSSGVENFAPIDADSLDALEQIATSFIRRRQHHPSLLLWSGGNELADRSPRPQPLGTGHPMLHRLQEVVAREDPERRFVPTSPSGPRYTAHPDEFGKELHWDVHGEWKPPGSMDEWRTYWNDDDALFRSEIGSPGAANTETILRYCGDLDPLPVDSTNPLWRNPVAWWVEADQFRKEHERLPDSLEEYVAWSQNRQAEALTIAATSAKSRWPSCGGVLLWCGHDSAPCPANTSIIDFDGKPKPAFHALRKIFASLDGKP
jgi:beta-mannosidase